jgi:ATP-binding cassette subfamily B protein
MDQGRITACGTHEELLETSDIYREIFRTQTSDEGEEAQA